MISGYLFSDSDSDDDQVKNLVAHRRMLRSLFDPLDLPDEKFIKSFRVSKQAFLYILSEIEPKFPPIKGLGLSPKEALAVTLRFLAEGSYQHGVGQDFNVAIAQATFSVTFGKCLKIVEETLGPKWVNMEMNPNEQQDARRYFYTRSSIPGIVMCVDGTHIRIIAPVCDRDQHYNRKGFYSLNVMVVCDHKMRFRYVDARYSGSNHDAHVWSVSGIDNFFADKHRNGQTNFKVLADSAYPSKPWIVTPKRNAAANSADADFNTNHAKGREIVERTIGVLKNRFRCLLGARQLHYIPEKAGQITNVCCILHNICIAYKLQEFNLEGPANSVINTDVVL